MSHLHGPDVACGLQSEHPWQRLSTAVNLQHLVTACPHNSGQYYNTLGGLFYIDTTLFADLSHEDGRDETWSQMLAFVVTQSIRIWDSKIYNAFNALSRQLQKGNGQKTLKQEKKKQPEEDTHLFYKDFEGESMQKIQYRFTRSRVFHLKVPANSI